MRLSTAKIRPSTLLPELAPPAPAAADTTPPFFPTWFPTSAWMENAFKQDRRAYRPRDRSPSRAYPDRERMEERTKQRPGAVQRGHFREIETVVENPDAEPALPCAAAKPAIIVYGKRVGTTLTVCMDSYSRSINRADSFAGSDDRHSTAQNRESGKPRQAPPGERERPWTY